MLFPIISSHSKSSSSAHIASPQSILMRKHNIKIHAWLFYLNGWHNNPKDTIAGNFLLYRLYKSCPSSHFYFFKRFLITLIIWPFSSWLNPIIKSNIKYTVVHTTIFTSNHNQLLYVIYRRINCAIIIANNIGGTYRRYTTL